MRSREDSSQAIPYRSTRPSISRLSRRRLKRQWDGHGESGWGAQKRKVCQLWQNFAGGDVFLSLSLRAMRTEWNRVLRMALCSNDLVCDSVLMPRCTGGQQNKCSEKVENKIFNQSHCNDKRRPRMTSSKLNIRNLKFNFAVYASILMQTAPFF